MGVTPARPGDEAHLDSAVSPSQEHARARLLGTATEDPLPEVEREARPTVLASFAARLFAETTSWWHAKSILANGTGGTFGLAGPRGAGKTWIMLQAIDSAERDGGLGVWFPSPSEYEPSAFLASISEVTAIEFQRYYDERTGAPPTATARRRLLSLRFSSTVLGLISVVFIITLFFGGSLLFLVALALIGFFTPVGPISASDGRSGIA